ncbi:MAG: HIG1 domain-containing protein [Xanthomonadales bacterium]|nr:HIG1 domain-containing protein [Xanthomonadales bacterium]
MDLLTVIIILALLATVVALLFGLTSMGQGGSFDKDFGTGFMWARVGLQAVAVLLLVVALFLR